MKYILALDQGTTSSRAILFNEYGELLFQVSKEFKQYYPKSGWVEHDPLEIWQTILTSSQDLITKSKVNPDDIVGLGITNQRETTLLWERATGIPISPAIVWQDRRTSEMCDRLKEKGYAELIKEKTGLVLDSYFSGTKIAWILDHIPDARKKAEAGELCFGTVDSWLIWNLTKGSAHVTDITNASRTLLFNIHELKWDQEILELLNIPINILPTVVESSNIVGYTEPTIFGVSIPIGGIAGDQQAALFGQCCFEAGTVKNTYGTGCFLLMNTGNLPFSSQHGLLTTIAWSIRGKVEYALEGSVFIAGALIQWLRDDLGLISNAMETEEISKAINDCDGVFIVPAFTGLGAPYWDSYARGLISGITRGTKRAHIVRAALESVAYQTMDVVRVMKQDSNLPLVQMNVDGGMTKNRFLLQFQSNLLGIRIEKPIIEESTALGAAFLAGLAVGLWKDFDELKRLRKISNWVDPEVSTESMLPYYEGWLQAVDRSKSKL